MRAQRVVRAKGEKTEYSEHHFPYLAALLDGIEALPDHGDDGPAAHVGDETGEERLVGQILVVLVQQVLGRIQRFKSHKLEALALKARDDLPHEATLDAVGFDHYVF